MLRFDPEAGKYVGWYGRLPVIVDARMFAAALAALHAAGMSAAAARAQLLQVDEWVGAAVERLPAVCTGCGAQVQPGRRFCGVVCEAARVVFRHTSAAGSPSTGDYLQA